MIEIKNIKNIRGIISLDEEIQLDKNQVFYASNGTFKSSLYNCLKYLYKEEFQNLKDHRDNSDGEITFRLSDNSLDETYIFSPSSKENEINWKKIKDKFIFEFLDEDKIEDIVKEINQIYLSSFLYDEEIQENYKFFLEIKDAIFYLVDDIENKDQIKILIEKLIYEKNFLDKNFNKKTLIKKLFKPQFIKENGLKDETIENYDKIWKEKEDLELIIKKYDDLGEEKFIVFFEILNLKKIENFDKIINSIFDSKIFKEDVSIKIYYDEKNKFQNKEELKIYIENKIFELTNKNLEDFFKIIDHPDLGAPGIRKDFLENREDAKKLETFLSFNIFNKQKQNKNTEEQWKNLKILIDILKTEEIEDFVSFEKYIKEKFDSFKMKDNSEEQIQKIKNNISFAKKYCFSIEEKTIFLNHKIKFLKIETILSNPKKIHFKDLDTFSSSEQVNIIMAFFKLTNDLYEGEQIKIVLIDDVGDKFDYKNQLDYSLHLKELINEKTKIIYFSHNYALSKNIFLELNSSNKFIWFEDKNRNNNITLEKFSAKEINEFLQFEEEKNDLSSLPFLRGILDLFPFESMGFYEEKKYINGMFHFNEQVNSKRVEELIKKINDIFKIMEPEGEYYSILDNKTNEIIEEYNLNLKKISKKEEFKNKIILSLYIRVFFEKFLQEKYQFELNSWGNYSIKLDKIIDIKIKEFYLESKILVNEFLHMNNESLFSLVDTNYKFLIDFTKKLKLNIENDFT